MKSQDYWKRRFELLEQAQNQKGIDYYHSIERQYRQAANEVEKEIVKWYSRFATENGISMSEAKRLLNSRELAEFRWDVKEYIKHGEQLGLDNTWMKQLENASARVHVSRLEALKVQIQQRAEVVMGNELDGLDKLAREVFTDGYYHTAFEIQKGFGVGWDLMKLDTRRIDKVISKPWAADGMNFSQRIWRDRAQLVNELHTQLTQTIITGGSPETAVKALSKRFDVSKAKARRLVMTESAFFASAAQQDCFNDLDVEKYEIVATLDLKTSPTCRSLDGKVFPMSEYKVGITAPPFHQYCRTVTVPWFEDNEIAERAARGADGKTYYVKGDMKYPDWYNSFVDGGSKEGLTDFVSKSFTERINNLRNDYEFMQQSLTDKNDRLKVVETSIDDYNDDIYELQMNRKSLNDNLSLYDDLKTRDLQAELLEKEMQYAKVESRVKELDSINDRFYNRPDRGTAEYEDWRKWRRTVDFETSFNDLIDSKQELITLKRELDDHKLLINFKDNFDLDEVTKRIDLIDKDYLSKSKSLTDLLSEKESLKSEISKLIVDSEKQLQSAGKEVIVELNNAKIAERSKRYSEVVTKNNTLAKSYHSETDQAIKRQIFDEWTKVNKELYSLQEKVFFENAQDVKNILSQTRKMGSDGSNVLAHLNNTKSTSRKAVLNAYDHYPNDWVKTSIKAGKMSVKTTKRGYYSSFDELIAISGKNEATKFETAIHELGHRLESIMPDLLKAEKQFYDRRTANDALKWLGKGYGKKEVARFDKFIDPYMGKDYGGKHYELVSMGFQYAFTDPTKLLSDPDMAEWIYGLLTLK